MTRNEIIRELRDTDPCLVKRLSIVYHNSVVDSKYVFSYEYTSHASLDLFRELVRVISSLWKLRGFVVSINVEYFPFDDDYYAKDYGKCLHRSFISSHYVFSVSDFIKTIKK